MEKGIIDRFEGNIAVIEINGITREFPKASLPKGSKAGDCVEIEAGEIRLDTEETTKRKKEIKDLMDELFE
ncbi:DUF3006 domain-containing protein [Cohnella abietis]|uniref:Uncharacterized protein n=1 Tax=Cohnella abietis TaxID=2507935 RepID=A0A3T1D952_9BACL|nr:DUF3006 domain-containing protein [Cohnella abietis]BBI34627.1 hypothetical protein KCTCHS21_40260 [Cohnella abietis]